MELFPQLTRYVSKVAWIPVVVLGAFFLFQVHQLTTFNPYWGYDGGAHLNILETLLREHRFPSLAENYLAWHEPFYYLLLAGLGMLAIPFWVSHACIVLLLDVLVFTLMRRMGLSQGFALAASIAVLALPAFLEVSMFFTNEALNYVFLLGIMHTALTLWREDRWEWKTSVLFAVCVGLGVVTKITALVAFGVAVILLGIKMARTKMWRYALTILITVLFAGACYAPWYVVRSQGLAQASINNYDMLPAKAFALDDRVHFMTWFDADIFTFPFWYSGGTGFWSMLYADTVSDYLGIFEHQDAKLALPASELVLTTHNGNSVSAYRKPLAQFAMWLGLVPVGVMLWGFFGALWAVVRDVRAKRWPVGDELVVLGFSSALLLALMYYAYRYPYYDQGVVKSIFIAPMFVLLVAFGMKYLSHKIWWIQLPLAFFWTGYIGVVLFLFFLFP